MSKTQSIPSRQLPFAIHVRLKPAGGEAVCRASVSLGNFLTIHDFVVWRGPEGFEPQIPWITVQGDRVYLVDFDPDLQEEIFAAIRKACERRERRTRRAKPLV